jgi:hypothetical protein
VESFQLIIVADNVIQHSFSSGELSPSLLARTDIPKYKSGAATMRNFLVDFRSGASTRSGLAFANQTKFSPTNFVPNVRLIPFQFSAEIGFVIEFGNFYCRFYINGGSVLEPPFAITGITNANPAVATITGNNFAVGNWIFITGTVGMPQIDNRYYYVSAVAGANVTLQDTITHANINSTGYGVYSSGGTAGRVYEIASPYAASDLALLKFAQLANNMVLVHPLYRPYVLTAYAATNWTLNPIVFGTTISSPTIASATPTAVGTANYSYEVTAVDANGQESGPSAPFAVLNAVNIGTTAGSINVVWSAVAGAISYNVYKAEIGVGNPVPTGSAYGFIQSATGTSLVDSNIVPDFTQSPPIISVPYLTSSVISYTVTAAGTYTTVPGVTVAAPPTGMQATANASLGVLSGSLSNPGTNNVVTTGNDPTGSLLTLANGVTFLITSAGFINAMNGRWAWTVTTATLQSAGSLSGAGTSTPTNPTPAIACNVPGMIDFGGVPPRFTCTWGVTAVIPAQQGSGYPSGSPPAVTFSAGAAAATAVLGGGTGTAQNPLSNGNPGCTTFFQQRLYFAASTNSPTTFWASQPGLYTNFNISDPIIDSDAIQGTLVSTQFNTIKSMLPLPGGLLILTAAGAWQLSSGAGGLASTAAVTPTNATATPQAYNGVSDVPPIVVNYDVLYVQSKGSIVRDLSYNIYANIYTGSDISILSNHLFFGHLIREWAWAEEPFRVVWAVRDDGALLSLTYVKDQEMLGWARHDTQGQFTSVAVIREGINDVAYFAVIRVINGNVVQSVERMVPRYLTYGAEDAFSVDCGFTTAGLLTTSTSSLGATTSSGAVTFICTPPGIFTAGNVGQIFRMNGGIAVINTFTSAIAISGNWIQPIPNPSPGLQVALPGTWSMATPATTYYGLDYLNGATVSILADGQVVPQQTVVNGSITLPFAATKATAGLPFQAQLQTMYLDAGEPTVQGKRKVIPRVTMRARESRGIKMGRTFPTILPVKQFNPTPSGQPITSVPPSPLVSVDVYYVMDPLWETAGQLCVQVDDPVPASVLGVIPEVVIGDTSGGGRGK